MTVSIQITNTEIFAFIPVLVFSYWAVKFCLKTKKTIETVKKSNVRKQIQLMYSV